jgi:uncharacterized protein
MSLRDRTQQLLESPGWPRVVLWAIAPILCVVLPGLGAMLAFVWLKLIAWGLALAVVVQLMSGLAIEPFAQWVTHQAPDTSKLQGIVGNWRNLLIFLALSWLVGGLLEEVVFRGFIIGYGTLVFGEKFRWWLAVASSVIFGFSHLYQGAGGVLLTGVVGFILASAYIVSRKNLPLTMLAHGFIDTISMIGLFTGLLSA